MSKRSKIYHSTPVGCNAMYVEDVEDSFGKEHDTSELITFLNIQWIFNPEKVLES